MLNAGDVISYREMCAQENFDLQKGMNFHLRGKFSVILMSQRKGAKYDDKVEDEGRMLTYEGHDIPRRAKGPEPKDVDQPFFLTEKRLTENGMFFEAARRYRDHVAPAELVKVYEKINSGIWVYNGIFELVDALEVTSQDRRVFKFKLKLVDDVEEQSRKREVNIEHERMIPTSVKLEVWKRDGGKCVTCGSKENLHFDHILPYSKGGTSLLAKNIQILCAKHNLAKSDRIE
ncbi:MAG: HNH endonuclease [Patescibacteria group bacterium]|nr:HNH endonuclease [Patescibacteria group bacterium]